MSETATSLSAPSRSQHYEEIVRRALPSFVIVFSRQNHVIDWNDAAARTFGLSFDEVFDKEIEICDLSWDLDITKVIQEVVATGAPLRLNDVPYTRLDRKSGVLGMTVIPFNNPETVRHLKCFIIGTDITERKALEHQLGHAQRMESIGQLAAGVAHEINTPIQYVGDNTRFLGDVFADIGRLLQLQQEVFQDLDPHDADSGLSKLHKLAEEIDLEFLVEEIPAAIEQSQKGLLQVTDIVKAMKQFAHPGDDEMVETDLNAAITSTITVTRNEWKYDAEMVTELDPDLPRAPCLASELNQVLLNLIVNAAHAVRAKKESQGSSKGQITVRTEVVGSCVQIGIADNGTGIAEEHRSRVFDHFFTTKEIGKGTGQGLSIAYSVVHDKHDGEIFFESEVGQGTTFFVRIPIHQVRDTEGNRQEG